MSLLNLLPEEDIKEKENNGDDDNICKGCPEIVMPEMVFFYIRMRVDEVFFLHRKNSGSAVFKSLPFFPYFYKNVIILKGNRISRWSTEGCT